MTGPDPWRPGAVLIASATLSITFVIVGLVWPMQLTRTLAAMRGFVVDVLGPVYPVTVTALLVLVLVLWLSPMGRLRLGGPDSHPEFGAMSWIAMLMSAGVGLSFLFWGTAQALIHLNDPPYGASAAGSTEAARAGIRYAFLFWGPHAWAIYALVAVSVGYAAFTHGRQMLVSAALRPVLGRHADGAIGSAVDVLAVMAILFGVATSFGARHERT